MSTEIAALRDRMDVLREFANDAACAEILPQSLRGKPANIALVLHTGHELGLSPMQALRSIHIIEGRATLSADLMAGLVMASPLCRYLRPVELTAERATYETMRAGWDAPLRVSYTIEDAQRAGALGKANWKAHPSAMLKARCLTTIARAAYPDIVMGLYDPDETEDAPPALVEATVVRDVTDATPATSKLKSKVAAKVNAPAGDDAFEIRDLIDAIAAQLKELGSSESDLRALIDVEQGELPPPISKWKAETCRAVLAKLRNGWGEKLRALADADAATQAHIDDDSRGAG